MTWPEVRTSPKWAIIAQGRVMAPIALHPGGSLNAGPTNRDRNGGVVVSFRERKEATGRTLQPEKAVGK